MATEVIIRSEYDVARFVNAQPASKSAIYIVLISLGGMFIDAYDFTSIGVGIVQLRTEFHLSPFAVGSVTAMMALGAFVGAIWGGYFTDKAGRFKMFLVDLVLLVVAALGAALSTNVWILLFFRLLLGIGVGLDFPVALSFIAEYVNARKRGSSVNLWAPLWFVATACTGLIILPFYYFVHTAYLWRIAVGFGAVPALIVLILRYKYMDESPTWAAHNVGLHEAGRVLEKMYGVKVQVIAEERKTEAKKVDVNFFEIFSPKYRLRTFLVTIISITQSFEYFAVAFNIPTISTHLFGGAFINAILGTVFFNIFGIVGGFVGAGILSKIGVRRLTIIGYGIGVVSLFVIYLGGTQFSVLTAALLFGIFIFAHAGGQGGTGMTMAALSYPTRIRGVGTGFAQGMTRVGSILGFYFFPLVVAQVGINKMLLYLVIFPLIAFIATIAIKWEPVGKDIELEGAEKVASSTGGTTTAGN